MSVIRIRRETARARAFSAPVQACMGGWCTKRDHCAHFHATDRRQPAERLCVPGADGVGRSVVIHRPVGAWEESHAAWQ